MAEALGIVNGGPQILIRQLEADPEPPRAVPASTTSSPPARLERHDPGLTLIGFLGERFCFTCGEFGPHQLVHLAKVKRRQAAHHRVQCIDCGGTSTAAMSDLSMVRPTSPST